MVAGFICSRRVRSDVGPSSDGTIRAVWIRGWRNVGTGGRDDITFVRSLRIVRGDGRE